MKRKIRLCKASMCIIVNFLFWEFEVALLIRTPIVIYNISTFKFGLKIFRFIPGSINFQQSVKINDFQIFNHFLS